MGYRKKAPLGKINDKGETTNKSDRLKELGESNSHGHKEVKAVSAADRKKAIADHAKAKAAE